VSSGWRCGDESLDPSLHLSEIDSRVTARPVGKLHRETEDGQLPRNVAQAGHHVALARYRDHGTRTTLPDDSARELAARRDEDRNLVSPRDLEHAVERLFRQTPGDQHQQLALPDPAVPPLRERVVDVDRRMFDPVTLAKRSRDQGRVVHELQIGTTLQQTLGQQISCAIESRREHAEVQPLERGEGGQGDPQSLGQRSPEPA